MAPHDLPQWLQISKTFLLAETNGVLKDLPDRWRRCGMCRERSCYDPVGVAFSGFGIYQDGDWRLQDKETDYQRSPEKHLEEFAIVGRGSSRCKASLIAQATNYISYLKPIIQMLGYSIVMPCDARERFAMSLIARNKHEHRHFPLLLSTCHWNRGKCSSMPMLGFCKPPTKGNPKSMLKQPVC